MDGNELENALHAHRKIAKLYADDRFPGSYSHPDLRTFAIAIVWIGFIECPPKEQHWERLCDVLNVDMRRIWQVIADDAPRYEPPELAKQWNRQCEAPMIRREGLCGKHASSAIRITDPGDGTWRMAAHCSRHEDWGHHMHLRERALQQAGGIPEPMPNTGGLLPCHFTGDWARNYETARPGWKAPKVGIRAEDWPVMAKVAVPVSLSLLEGDGLVATGTDTPRPSLRLA